MKTRIVLDSGAFTAWTTGVQVDIDEYISFIKEHSEHIDAYVNLDVLPGKFGEWPTAKQVEQSAQQGWENYLYMCEMGLDPIPVFHMGEQMRWMTKMMDHGCKYVGVSPANDRHVSMRRAWMDTVYDHICDDKGWPLIKTHGFAVTAVDLLMRYPWYSADSTSWKMYGTYGSLIVPRSTPTEEYSYQHGPITFAISDRRGSALKEGKHFRNFGPSERDRIVRYLDMLGVTVEEVRSDSYSRDFVNGHFFKTLSDRYIPRPFVRKQRSLL